MNTKHTPGPWKIQNGKGEYEKVVTAENYIICRVYADSKDPGKWDYANARLIAAAPELLEALLSALEWWHSISSHFTMKEPAWVAQARDAIARATDND